ncbi:MAG: hypothetical protein D6710_10915 [Nitrospirae bacterium]|nr:MAG: hypothetical protein D6710_10915 [Nitrospirota bacterium]
MEKLIRHLRPSGSLGKGCGVHAKHPILKSFYVFLVTNLLSVLGAWKPKHPSGHPPVLMGSNFSSTPLGGILKPLMVNNTFGGKGLVNKRLFSPGIKNHLKGGFNLLSCAQWFQACQFLSLN